MSTEGAMNDNDLMEVRSTDVGSLGILHLKRLWAGALARNRGRLAGETQTNEGHIDQFVLDGLELGIIETFQFINLHKPDFAEFEAWVMAQHAGFIPPETREKINRAVTHFLGGQHQTYPLPVVAQDRIFSQEEWACWEENGYVVLKNAVPREDCAALEQAIWEHLGLFPDDPAGWQSWEDVFWVKGFRHHLSDQNRRSTRIHRAFAEIWGTDALFHAVNRLSFNPPLGAEYKQYGPSKLHWDTSIAQPMIFDVFGMLYLNDVAENQGAFQCVPGFHRKIGSWLNGLPEGADPRNEILDAFPTVKIGGKAGDLIICRQELPHGSSVNRGDYPRFVQYMAMYPADRAINPVWK